MSLTPAELDDILAEVLAVARDAAALVLSGLERPKTVGFKGAIDLVTEYDRRSEALIVDELTRRFPRARLVAEEGGAHGPADAPLVFVADPLDGTTNFAHGHPAFAVSIGLVAEGRPVLGAVIAPALGHAYGAREGGGATRDGRPVRVSTTPRLDLAFLATGFPYDRRVADDENIREHYAFLKRTQGIRRLGAAALDLALVAEGVYDGYWEPRLKPWDLAAGVVLVAEAGGHTSGFAGDPVDLAAGNVVASNGRLHGAMLEVLALARRDLHGPALPHLLPG